MHARTYLHILWRSCVSTRGFRISWGTWLYFKSILFACNMQEPFWSGALPISDTRGYPIIQQTGLSHYPPNGALPLSNKRGSPIIQHTRLSHYPTHGAHSLSNKRGSPIIQQTGLSHYPTNGALPLSNKRGSPIIQETGLSHYPTNGALPLSNERGSSIIRKRGSPIIQQTGLFHYPKTGLSHHVAIGAHPLSEIVCEKGSGFRVCMGEETLSINITIIISCAKGLGFGV